MSSLSPFLVIYIITFKQQFPVENETKFSTCAPASIFSFPPADANRRTYGGGEATCHLSLSRALRLEKKRGSLVNSKNRRNTDIATTHHTRTKLSRNGE